jgi:hypothetical protein
VKDVDLYTSLARDAAMCVYPFLCVCVLYMPVLGFIDLTAMSISDESLPHIYWKHGLTERGRSNKCTRQSLHISIDIFVVCIIKHFLNGYL